MSFQPCCVENVKKIGGVLCPWETCSKLQDRIDAYCWQTGQASCAPIPQEVAGISCFCCCTNRSASESVETETGDLMAVQDVVEGVDCLMAGRYVNHRLSWSPRVADFCRGIELNSDAYSSQYHSTFLMAYQPESGDPNPVPVLATHDQLFLMSNGKLRPVQHLQPGDTLLDARGGSSQVQFVMSVNHSGYLHQLSFDGFDNLSLDDHLINANGVVCADYSVQLAFSNGTLNPKFLDPTGDQIEDTGTVPAAGNDLTASNKETVKVDLFKVSTQGVPNPG